MGAFGEGYHNNHHAKPRCAAHGHKWWEFDLTRYLIWTLEKCGLAWNVVWPEAETATSAGDAVSEDQAGALLIFGKAETSATAVQRQTEHSQ
jgi:hypothetical protein